MKKDIRRSCGPDKDSVPLKSNDLETQFITVPFSGFLRVTHKNRDGADSPNQGSDANGQAAEHLKPLSEL